MFVLINPNRKMDSYIVAKDVNNGRISFDQTGRAYVECSERAAREYASIFDAELISENSEKPKVVDEEPLKHQQIQSPKRNQKSK
ncbi:hypothetical protein MASR1M107_05730 [Ignavibacteriales bacterium]